MERYGCFDTLYHKLIAHPGVQYAVAVIDHETIDRINIFQATLLAMRKAVEQLIVRPEIVIVDGPFAPPALPMLCIPVVKGDRYCRCVSAASVIAKGTRDAIMRDYDTEWPQYGFADHKGYSTPEHLERLRHFGPCPIHRVRSVCATISIALDGTCGWNNTMLSSPTSRSGISDGVFCGILFAP